jgi:phosphoribosylformylglycinamidine cyclo-ligase
MSHITGHGLLKLMRPPKPLTYRIDALPAVPEVLDFLVRESALDAHAAFSTFNMGCGYAIYCGAGVGAEIVELAAGLGLGAVLAGRVEEGPRQVIVEPVGVRYAGSELELSAG